MERSLFVRILGTRFEASVVETHWQHLVHCSTSTESGYIEIAQYCRTGKYFS